MEPDKKSNGAMVGLVIIILILLVGGIYMWQQSKKEEPPRMEDTETVAGEETASDEDLNALENDLNSGTEFDVNVESVE